MSKDRATMLAAITHPDSTTSEAFRTLRTNIEFSDASKNVKTILITSAMPQEGKTSVAINLGAVFSQMGKKVLVVDSDLRNPSLHLLFGLANSNGLSSVLTNGNIEDMPIVEVPNADNLFILPSGPIPKNPAELLISTWMKKFIKSARESFDLVIFDSPPLLPVTDAAILSRDVDAVLLVARSAKTTIQSLQRAKLILDNIRTKILGIILNDIVQKEEKYSYYNYSSKANKDLK